jgi:hypothetical protein
VVFLRFFRIVFLDEAVDRRGLNQDVVLRRKTFFRIFLGGSRLAIGAVGIVQGRAIAADMGTVPVQAAGLLTEFFALVVLFVVLHVCETIALGQLSRLEEGQITVLLRPHFLLGIVLPWLLGLLGLFLAAFA